MKLVMVALKLVEVDGLGGCVVDIANFQLLSLATESPYKQFKVLSIRFHSRFNDIVQLRDYLYLRGVP